MNGWYSRPKAFIKIINVFWESTHVHNPEIRTLCIGVIRSGFSHVIKTGPDKLTHYKRTFIVYFISSFSTVPPSHYRVVIRGTLIISSGEDVRLHGCMIHTTASYCRTCFRTKDFPIGTAFMPG